MTKARLNWGDFPSGPRCKTKIWLIRCWHLFLQLSWVVFTLADWQLNKTRLNFGVLREAFAIACVCGLDTTACHHTGLSGVWGWGGEQCDLDVLLPVCTTTSCFSQSGSKTLTADPHFQQFWVPGRHPTTSSGCRAVAAKTLYKEL